MVVLGNLEIQCPQEVARLAPLLQNVLVYLVNNIMFGNICKLNSSLFLCRIHCRIVDFVRLVQ